MTAESQSIDTVPVSVTIKQNDVGPHFQLYRTSAGGPVRWRLLGGNNRPIGRSALDHLNVPTCLSSIAQLVAVLPELTGRVDRNPPNLWSWRLGHDGDDVAVSAHPYDRQVRSLHAMRQFLDRAAVARIDAAVLVTDARRGRSVSSPPVGRRGWSR